MSTTNEGLVAETAGTNAPVLPSSNGSQAPIATPDAGAPSGGEAGTSGSIARLILRVFVENKLAVVGVVIVLVMLLFSFVGPLFYHTNQTTVNLNDLTLAPSSSHPLGTDGNGLDILGRLMLGGQTSLEVGLAAAAIATLIGIMWGAVAGFFGGVVDAVMMRIVDVVLSIPALFLLIVLSVEFSPDKLGLILIIGGLAWLTPARLVRGETLTLRTREYVQAVRVMGGRGRRMVIRHIIPNAIGTIVVNATFQVADAILTIAALGYLNLGIQFPQTDWGSMLSDGTTYVDNGFWWMLIPAGACIVLVVVAFNFIGDALRDSLEVRLQQR
ncbi:MAG: ABC transporter permease [Acidimicrobiales bacterium]